MPYGFRHFTVHLKPNHDTSDAPGCTVVYQVMISNLSGQHVPDKNRSSRIKYCVAGHHKAPQTNGNRVACNLTCYTAFKWQLILKIRCESTCRCKDSLVAS